MCNNKSRSKYIYRRCYKTSVLCGSIGSIGIKASSETFLFSHCSRFTALNFTCTYGAGMMYKTDEIKHHDRRDWSFAMILLPMLGEVEEVWWSQIWLSSIKPSTYARNENYINQCFFPPCNSTLSFLYLPLSPVTVGLFAQICLLLCPGLTKPSKGRVMKVISFFCVGSELRCWSLGAAHRNRCVVCVCVCACVIGNSACACLPVPLGWLMLCCV